MALPRVEQEIQERYPSLGIEECHLVNYLVDLCKGRLVGQEHEWFYLLFLDRSAARKFNSTEDVRDVLQSSWWIEEEDLRQEIIYLLLCRRRTNKLHVLTTFIGWQLRDYLLSQDTVFKDKRPNWDSKYLDYLLDLEDSKRDRMEDDTLISFDAVLDAIEFDLFTGYWVYLYYESGLTLSQISKILQICERQARRHNRRIKKKLMEKMNEKAAKPD